MAITVVMTRTSNAPPVANSKIDGVVAVTNDGANTVSVQSVALSEQSTLGTSIRQPDFLVPNAAPGTYPTIASAATSYFPFSVVAAVPNTPGASPNAPNAYHPNNGVSPPANTILRLEVQVRTYDSVAGAFVIGSALLQFPLAPAVAQFPQPQGGAAQFNSGMDAVNWFFAFH